MVLVFRFFLSISSLIRRIVFRRINECRAAKLAVKRWRTPSGSIAIGESVSEADWSEDSGNETNASGQTITSQNHYEAFGGRVVRCKENSEG